MDPKSRRELLDNFFSVTGLAFSVFTGTAQLRYCADGWSEQTREDYYSYIIQDFELQHRDEQRPLLLIFDSDFLIGIAKLDESTYLATAPVTALPKSREQWMRFCAPAIREEKLVRFCDNLMTLPRFQTGQFLQVFSLLIFLCSGRQISPGDILLANSAPLEISHEPMQTLFRAREETDWHVDQSFEERICAAIERGDEELLIRRMNAPGQGRVGIMSLNTMNQARYTFISFATLITRAAIRGGLPQETAFSLSDIYCQQMDRSFDLPAIELLSIQLALEFCRRVRERQSAARYSPTVRRCVDYIEKHLHDPIRLEDISRECGLCTKSISRKFREETGLAIPDYVGSERIREAKYLLQHSDYSLAEISSILQYNSQSYFTQKFREETGMTPQKYRDACTNR